ncbi:MAG: hypothetical protein KatS3mg107_0454 [Gemmataceae bacterium]|nr:MAG: hypothetical protein KatS3mg107_0454 [Gemmataceae bacterium]
MLTPATSQLFRVAFLLMAEGELRLRLPGENDLEKQVSNTKQRRYDSENVAEEVTDDIT